LKDSYVVTLIKIRFCGLAWQAPSGVREWFSDTQKLKDISDLGSIAC